MNKLTILFLITALLFTACNKEEEYTPAEKGKKTISLILEFQEPQEVETRAVNDTRIYNIVVMAFDSDGQLISRRSSFNNTPIADNFLSVDGVEITEGSTLYAIANIGHNTSTDKNAFEKAFMSISDENTLLLMIQETKVYTDIPVTTNGSGVTTQGLVMVGKRTFTDINVARVVVPMQRVAARLSSFTVNVNTNVDPDFKLIGARVACLPNACYLIPKNKDLTLTDQNFITSDWFAPDAGSRKLQITNFYMFENHKGTGPDKSQLASTDVTPHNASYLQILATYKGHEYVYKVFIGKDNSTNYDIDRNTNYTITVDINGLAEIYSDIRISRFFYITETDWYLTDGLVLHYDGIKNNGNDARVTNATDTIADPRRPNAVNAANNNFYYDYTVLPGGQYIPVVTNSPATDGKKNRWKNIAPATYGEFNIPIYTASSSGNIVKGANSPIWGPDCLSLNGNFIASMEVCDERIFTEYFTIECVFLATEANTASGGNDLFAFWHTPDKPRYVIADVETYQNGLGFIAGTYWNGMNYGTSMLINRKHRVVIQFDGHQLMAWLGNKMVYTEQKATLGPIPWQKGPLGSPGPNCPPAKGTAAAFATQLTLGSWVRHNTAETFRGNIYSFRYYGRLLSKVELDYNFSMDIRRFGVVNLIN